MSIYVTGGAEQDEAGTARERKLESALTVARLHLATLGGDFSAMSEFQANLAGVDMIQWEVLRTIDAALAEP